MPRLPKDRRSEATARLAEEYLRKIAPKSRRHAAVLIACSNLGVHESQVYNWLAGANRPNSEALVKMARAVGKPGRVAEVLAA